MFTYDRGRQHQFGSFMEEEIEEEAEGVQDEPDSLLHDSGGSHVSQPQLSELDQGKLQTN